MLWIVTSYRNISLRLNWFSITYFSLLLFVKVYYTMIQIRCQVTPHCLKSLHHKFIFSLFSRNKPYLLSNLLLSFTTVSQHSNFTGVILHFRAILETDYRIALQTALPHPYIQLCLTLLQYRHRLRAFRFPFWISVTT